MTNDSGRGPLSRRALLRRGALGLAGVAAGSRALIAAERNLGADLAPAYHGPHSPSNAATTGMVKNASIDPAVFLEEFDYGTVTRERGGRTVREFRLTALDRDIEVAPGVWYPAWTYNGQVPGPTLRATEGDLVRVHFSNAGTHAHTVHFHGIHPARMDGVYEVIDPGGEYVYEFEARPFGLHPYHCHAVPLKRHIAKGLYGALIVDPRTPRPPAREMVMMLNGFDTNFDASNEVYAVNTVPFAYHHTPIQVRRGELQRIYMVNVLEFDLVNSMHLHGNLFHVYRTGTKLVPDDYTDTVMFCQGERHILEFRYDDPGRFMFHAHQSEFAELGWMGVFEVSDGRPVA
jgi:FtsP/CotA-like multicopper oxidase with cupredoxin domain